MTFTLKRTGVSDVFIAWIRACVETPRFSIMINGALYGNFQAKRGIQQGDPMSPYLFVLVMELFTEIMREGKGTIICIIDVRIQKSHLSFTDDLCCFYKG